MRGSDAPSRYVVVGQPVQGRAERALLRGVREGGLLQPEPVAVVTTAPAPGPGQALLARIGQNQMLACNPVTGEVRRFLTAPTNCEVTGVTWAPDGRTMFLNIQHPGETPSDLSDPQNPTRFSNWPDFQPGGRPRSATVVVRRADGGVIGS